MARPRSDTAVSTEAELAAVTTRTAIALADQPRRKVRLYQVPKGSTERKLPDETVCINGHIFQIQRGVEVEVPETVYEVLEQAGRI